MQMLQSAPPALHHLQAPVLCSCSNLPHLPCLTCRYQFYAYFLKSFLLAKSQIDADVLNPGEGGGAGGGAGDGEGGRTVGGRGRLMQMCSTLVREGGQGGQGELDS